MPRPLATLIGDYSMARETLSLCITEDDRQRIGAAEKVVEDRFNQIMEYEPQNTEEALALVKFALGSIETEDEHNVRAPLRKKKVISVIENSARWAGQSRDAR